MKIHEYQAKQLFSNYGIPVPRGRMASSVEETTSAAAELSYPIMLKAQVHAGGRGKGGGVQRAATQGEVSRLAEKLIGMHLVTPQTGPDGKIVRKILVEEGVIISKELYLSILVDRTSSQIIIIASTSGGMDIEEVAKNSPEKIVQVAIDPLLGIENYHCRKITYALDLPPEINKLLIPLISRLYSLFVDCDCNLLEINPLVITADNSLLALDAKIDLDNNALYRQPEIQRLRDLEEEDPLEVQALKHNLNYIKLDGTIGNMVNGAGLAMATMDLIKKWGASPANFLDVGGGANAEMVENGFRIILGDPNVKAILVNIFGGILRCDVLAQGIVTAARNCSLNVPVIVRMEGTNAEAGRKILAESGLDIITAENLKEAGEKVAAFA